MTNEMALFKAAGLSLANIGKYKEALARVQATAPVMGGTPILRLAKEGVWRYGQQMTEIEPGSLWAVNPLTFEKGWVAWKTGVNKPVGKQTRNILTGELVDPNTLPDVGAEWSESVSVDFQCINGEDKGKVVSFATNSAGGVERWHELVAQLSHQFDVDPNKLVAVVSLEHDGYFHADQSYGARHPESKKPGWIVKPVFNVVDWLALDGMGAEPQQQPEGGGEDTEDPPEEPTPAQAAPPAGRRQSTIGNGVNGAAAPAATPSRRQSTIAPNRAQLDAQATTPSRRQSTIAPNPAQLDAQATRLTGLPAEPGPDPVVRRRRRAG
jgi:hypothetical protein